MMTNEKILAAVEACESVIRQTYGDTAERGDPDGHGICPAHVLYMCQEIRTMLAEGRREKVMRWLGFVQGALWADGLSTITELKEMNRP